jgi:hypothetical protein
VVVVRESELMGIKSITIKEPLYGDIEYKLNPRFDGGYDLWKRTYMSDSDWKILGIGLNLDQITELLTNMVN